MNCVFCFCRQIRDTVNWIFSEQMLVCYISVFRDTFWPDGKLAPHLKSRTDSERHETKERAQQKLLDNIPGGNACRHVSSVPSCFHTPILFALLLSCCETQRLPLERFVPSLDVRIIITELVLSRTSSV